jgi:hypothetical protein
LELPSKLQLQPGQCVEVVALPPADAPGLAGLVMAKKADGDSALLVFVTDRSVLEKHRPRIVKAASSDRLTWVCYPKAGKLGTDLNRDSLVGSLEAHSVQPVRQIAIDDTWSALRFRSA